MSRELLESSAGVRAAAAALRRATTTREAIGLALRKVYVPLVEEPAPAELERLARALNGGTHAD